MSRLAELIEQLCPDGVEYRALGDVAELKRGQAVTRKEIVEGRSPLLRVVVSLRTISIVRIGRVRQSLLRVRVPTLDSCHFGMSLFLFPMHFLSWWTVAPCNRDSSITGCVVGRRRFMH